LAMVESPASHTVIGRAGARPAGAAARAVPEQCPAAPPAAEAPWMPNADKAITIVIVRRIRRLFMGSPGAGTGAGL
jgi:hypothetical protein